MPFLKSNRLITKAKEWCERGLPFVIYREPYQKVLRSVFQADSELRHLEAQSDIGFVFSPFDTEKSSILITGETFEEEFHLTMVQETTLVSFPSEEAKQVHTNLVTAAIKELKSGALEKVVLSRALQQSTQKEPYQIFTSLLQQYASAFCYWWFHPKVGMWMGATPEQFVKFSGNKVSLIALAGTLPYVEAQSPNWTPKERDEQQMVTDYIVATLRGHVDKVNVSETNSSRAGRLWHLKSEISGKISSGSSLFEIVQALHPTPAVCGLPKNKAFEYILRNEGYDREFYTGFLGPLNLDSEGSANFFVNLRCLKLENEMATLYVGGGITAASNALQEWVETQFKSRTMLTVL